MPSLPLTAANTTISAKAGDIGASALVEIGVIAPGEAMPGDQAGWVLESLQRRIDLINAQKQLIYAVNFQTFLTPASTQPITIGPGAQFNVPDPPVRIESANWILPAGSSNIDLKPLWILTDQDWAQVSIKNLTSTLPTALYYSRGPAVGNIYLHPIPTVSQNIRLQLWSGLGQALAVGTNLSLPPAYWAYLVSALASDVAPGFGPNAVEIAQSAPFLMKYREARQAISGNNNVAPRVRTDVPGSKQSGVVPDFNYLTGSKQ